MFRIRDDDNQLTKRLLFYLNQRGNLYCIPTYLKEKYVIRFTVTSTYTTFEDILQDWREISQATDIVLTENQL